VGRPAAGMGLAPLMLPAPGSAAIEL
jgi:hypothetical protein